MSSIYFKCQIIVVLETPITLAISLVVTVIFIFDCDKNKLFIYPENELENQESVCNPTSGAGDM